MNLRELNKFYSPRNHQKTIGFDDFRGDRSYIIPLNSLKTTSEFRKRPLRLIAPYRHTGMEINEFGERSIVIRRRNLYLLEISKNRLLLFSGRNRINLLKFPYTSRNSTVTCCYIWGPKSSVSYISESFRLKHF